MSNSNLEPAPHTDLSDLRIALVAEGDGDLEIIRAALKAFLPVPFVLTLLQPEPTQPKLGTGWGGVAKWCHSTQIRHPDCLDHDPTLFNFDFLIIHLDVDVGGFQYTNYPHFSSLAEAYHWRPLPCAQDCPPVSATVSALTQVLESWLGAASLGDRTCLCLPAQSSGTWLATAVLAPNHPALQGGECDPRVEKRLATLPKGQRIKKTVRDYRTHAETLTQNWQQVKQHCTQAQAFEACILTLVNTRVKA